MDTPGLLLAAAAVLALVGVAALVATVVATRAERRRLAQELLTSRSEVAELRDRVEHLAARAHAPAARVDGPGGAAREGFVITSLRGGGASEEPATGADASELAPVPLSGRDFASVALTESAVRVASLAHGVRRALSAENRNRIRFEVRREVRRSRRQRRRDLKEARRHLRTHGAPAGRDAA